MPPTPSSSSAVAAQIVVSVSCGEPPGSALMAGAVGGGGTGALGGRLEEDGAQAVGDVLERAGEVAPQGRVHHARVERADRHSAPCAHGTTTRHAHNIHSDMLAGSARMCVLRRCCGAHLRGGAEVCWRGAPGRAWTANRPCSGCSSACSANCQSPDWLHTAGALGVSHAEPHAEGTAMYPWCARARRH